MLNNLVFVSVNLWAFALLIAIYWLSKGPRKRGNIVAETLLFPKMFPRLRGQETFVAETFFASEKQKMILTFFRNILFFQQMFPRLRGEETMFPQQCFRNNASSFAGALKY